MKYKCSISRIKDFDNLQTNLLYLDPNGLMKYTTNVYYPFSEKIMMFLLKQSLVLLGENKFEGSFTNVKKIMDITKKLEDILITKGEDLDAIECMLDNQSKSSEEDNGNDPEVPIVRKAKRSIDQIDSKTGAVIRTFESIEAAGRSLGLTTGSAIGIAVREKRKCRGFLWRYSGISKEEQFLDQPVVKVCCSTGQKTYFHTIADAARDVKISAPGLRVRILTNVHVEDHHWKFDKSATHYSSS
jgi:hypothetical protein